VEEAAGLLPPLPERDGLVVIVTMRLLRSVSCRRGMEMPSKFFGGESTQNEDA